MTTPKRVFTLRPKALIVDGVHITVGIEMKIYQCGMPEHKAEGIYFVDGKLWFTIEAFKQTKHIIPNDHRSNRHVIDILTNNDEARIVVKSGTHLTFAFEPEIIENYLDLHGVTPLIHSSQMHQ